MAKKTALSVLVKARELLTPPGAWVKNEWARNARGEHVLPDDKGAICFCAAGAIWRAGGRALTARSEARFTFAQANGGEYPLSFNDGPRRTQAQILKAFDRAIAKARAAA